MRLLLCLSLLHFSFLSFSQIANNAVKFDADSFNMARIKEVIGKPFNNFVVSNEKGSINNDSLKGKVVLINFWFEGCHPCVAEFPAFNELAEMFKGNKDFEFISFTRDNAETIKRVKDKYQLQFKVYYSKECSKLNQQLGYPTTMILDRQGKIKYLINGGSIDPAEARKSVMTNLLPEIQKELGR